MLMLMPFSTCRPAVCFQTPPMVFVGGWMSLLVAALPAQVAPGLQFAELGKRHLPAGADQTEAVLLSDLNGDGHADMICGNFGQNHLYLNDGHGVFADATAARMPVDSDSTTSIAIGDVDGDGDLDLVCENWVRWNSLYINLQRQLDAPYLLCPGHPYTLEAYSRHGTPGASEFAFVYLSTARLPTPVIVPAIGTRFIDPMAPLSFVSIPQANGVGTTTWNVPNNLAFNGVEILAQALIVQGGVDFRLSNATADLILR